MNLPADLQETALLHAHIRARFKKLFMQHGENEADAAAMADVATRDR